MLHHSCILARWAVQLLSRERCVNERMQASKHILLTLHLMAICHGLVSLVPAPALEGWESASPFELGNHQGAGVSDCRLESEGLVCGPTRGRCSCQHSPHHPGWQVAAGHARLSAVAGRAGGLPLHSAIMCMSCMAVAACLRQSRGQVCLPACSAGQLWACLGLV